MAPVTVPCQVRVKGLSLVLDRSRSGIQSLPRLEGRFRIEDSAETLIGALRGSYYHSTRPAERSEGDSSFHLLTADLEPKDTKTSCLPYL
jgi:hypothetical protein